MAYNPGVSFFIPFYELEPSKQRQCIYFTQKGARCRCPCEIDDNMRAIELRRFIIAKSTKSVDLDNLREYVLKSCCGANRARHQDRMEDSGLLMSLARRWQNEIQEQVADRSNFIISASATYISIPEAPLSEFRPHIAKPRHSDSTSWKLCENLRGRDFETGCLYMFDRASSPGHIKIGWTAGPVEKRLEGWSKCGYIPNLLSSISNIPHAQRAETLTHYELIKEWRRERMCQASWCRKSHQEWFEIDKERAAQVLENWAMFMKNAQPYDTKGSLKVQWRRIVQTMDGDGDKVTAKRLLEHYNMSITKETTRIMKQEDRKITARVREDNVSGCGSHVGGLESRKETLARMVPLHIEQQPLIKVTALLESDVLPSRIALLRNSLSIADEPPKSDLREKSPLSRTEPLLISESLSRTEIPQTAEPPSKHRSLPAKPTIKTEALPASEPTLEIKVTSQETYVKKELLPAHIPQKPFPPLHSTTVHENALPSEEGKSRQGSEVLKPSASPITTDSKTNMSIVDNSSNPKACSLIPVSASASPLAETISQVVAHTSTGTSTHPQRHNISDCSLYCNLTISPLTPVYPRPQNELISDPPPTPKTNISKSLVFQSTDGKEEIVMTLGSVWQHKRGVDRDKQSDAASEILACDEQKGEKEPKFIDQDEITVVENDIEKGAQRWDEEETLVEEVAERTFETTTLKARESLHDKKPAEKTRRSRKEKQM